MIGTLKVLREQIKLNKKWSELVYLILSDHRIQLSLRQEWLKKAQHIASKEPF